MTPQTPEQIAGKLTKAQGQTIVLARETPGGFYLPKHRDRGVMRKSIEAAGLCNEIGRLNRTGLQVRAILRGEHDR